MVSEGKYRFNLQWPSRTAEQQLAGDYLESLGNRKGAFVIMVVVEYLKAHPELTAGRTELVVKYSYTREELLRMIREAVAQFGPGLVPGGGMSVSVAPEEDVDEMLGFLDLF